MVMTAELVRLDSIRSADWQLKVGEIGSVVEGVDDVDQCIRTIVLTPRGAVPHRPEFGCDAWSFLDRPIDAARPQLIREVSDAIADWEPRAELLSVVVDGQEGEDTSVIVRITWRLRDTAEERSTAVSFTR